jgi:exosortase/archaeosortase family protein
MISAAARTRSRLGEAWRLVLPLGLALAGIWVIELHPAARGVLAPLGVLTAEVTAAMLGSIGLAVAREGAVLAHSQGSAWEIDYACTAFTPVVLLVAAIAPWPAPRRARILGAAAGVALVFSLNQARLVSLVWLGVHTPEIFDVAHTIAWPALLALATAGYWFGWVKATHRRSRRHAP